MKAGKGGAERREGRIWQGLTKQGWKQGQEEVTIATLASRVVLDSLMSPS